MSQIDVNVDTVMDTLILECEGPTLEQTADDEDPSQTNCLTSLFDNIGLVAQNINVVVRGLGERLGGVNLGGFFSL